MASTTRKGYWTGTGTRADPYRPDYASRYGTSWHVRSNARAADGVVVAEYSGTTQQIANIEADPGVLPASAELPEPEPKHLEMPVNSVNLTDAIGHGAGTRIELAQGIYTVSADRDIGIPDGTTITTLPDARVVITADNGGTPNFSLGSRTALSNLWMGGVYGTNDSAIEMGSACRIEGCTLFGWRQGIGEGDGKDNIYRNNRFIQCGTSPHDHAIYISGDTVGLRKNARIVGNLFIGCDGYCVHLYHKPTHCVVRGNFMARSRNLLVDDGYDHVIENNVLWSATGLSILPRGVRTQFTGNVICCGLPAYGAWGDRENKSGNLYVDQQPHVQDQSPLRVGPKDLRYIYGVSYLHIEQALDAIQSRFANPDTELYEDGTVDVYFDLLHKLTEGCNG